MSSIVTSRLESALSAMPVVPIRWNPAVRVIPRFPPIEELERFDSELQAAVLAELATVDPQVVGNPKLLPPGKLPVGPGASRIITSYTFSQPGRFNDETFAAFYGAESLATAIAETIHHILEALRDSNAPAQTLPPRLELQVDVDAADVVDARSASYPQVYSPSAYAESRCLGSMVHARGHDGLVYRSVRRAGGECVAIYAPRTLGTCRDGRELVYRYANDQLEVSEVLHRGGS